ncbi:hypothetical protein DFJ58DRAFT_660404 [Suillus subalutaceus]|uniref:uncharacterized protein n=1 Tax=Suillus subalutaceus TaxID=48586 RepID=UPI001B875465|nr:uncharacterized protein DFJ58DRAFT_660404 [Suillus subalutaceus]KAG1854455.1 hypothetical protein DFJ58DRAFT_660404 [Suillus subalutaceus]
MDSITFRFNDLPTELALLILRYAAQTTFDQAEKYDKVNCPYSSVLTLCLVSKNFRRAVLPALLHTVLLPKPRNVRVFVQALLTQEAYKQASSDLHFDYAPHVHKMWIGLDGGNLTSADLLADPREYALQPSERPLAINLLTPVMLAASSLALGWTSVDLLIECLEHAWESRPATPVNEEHPRLPWNTETLTLSCGDPINRTKWKCLTDTPQGSAFLASISHLLSPTYLCRDNPLQVYRLPEWMKTAPLASFKSLQTVILPYPCTTPPINLRALVTTGVDMQMHLLTLPATLLKDPNNGIPKAIKVFDDIIGPGEEATRSDGTRLQVSEVLWCSRSGWEKVWAWML